MRDGLDDRETSSAGFPVDYHFLAVLAVFDISNGQVDQFPDPGTGYL